MSRRRDVEPARELARRRERSAAGRLAVANQEVQASVARGEALRSYRQEYAARLALGTGVRPAVLLKDGQRFLQKLDQGIVQAEQHTRHLRVECERVEREWIATRVRAKALDKLVDRREAEAADRAASLEQREQDEYAGRR